MSIVSTPLIVTAGDNYTGETGTERVVAFAISTDCNATGITISDFQWGGVSGTIAAQLNDASELAAIAYFKESEIPVGSQVTAITYSSGSPDDARMMVYTLDGRDQTTPLDVTNTSTGDTTISSDTLVGVSGGADSVVSLCGTVPSRVITSVTGDYFLRSGANAGSTPLFF